MVLDNLGKTGIAKQMSEQIKDWNVLSFLYQDKKLEDNINEAINFGADIEVGGHPYYYIYSFVTDNNASVQEALAKFFEEVSPCIVIADKIFIFAAYSLELNTLEWYVYLPMAPISPREILEYNERGNYYYEMYMSI